MTSPVPIAARRLGDALRRAGEDRSRVTFPSSLFKGRIVDFARDVLGIRSLASHQVEIIEEYAGNEDAMILVCTGQKMGKTECMVIAAAYDFATERDVKVWLYAPKVDHTKKVFWDRFPRYIVNAFYPCASCMPAHRAWCALVEADPLDETKRPDRCQRCSPLIPSRLVDPKKPEKGRVSEWLNADDPEAGLKAPDGRVVMAYTGRKEGSKGGFSGKLRLLADECSDISDQDRETWAGNLQGGGKLMGFGNMLHVFGWFYRAFEKDSKEAQRWSKRVQKSSRYSPNCRGTITWPDGVTTTNNTTDRPIRGMATTQKIIDNIKAWLGTNYITARIDATPPKIVEGQLAPADRVAAAEARWGHDEATGLLQIGVDVARMRDKLAICVRRGIKMLELYAEALGEDDHARGVALTLDYCKKHRRPHERKPRLVFDASGLEGASFAKELRAQRAEEHVELYPIQMSHRPRNWKHYYHRRDEIAHAFAKKLGEIAILSDSELEGEIAATVGETVKITINSNSWPVLKVIENDALRPRIGRSPDKRNACELAFLDVDGSEVAANDVEQPAAKTEQAPVAEREAVAADRKKTPRAPSPPADDIEEVGSIYDRQAQVYAALWGAA
jgi:hypothetical protein